MSGIVFVLLAVLALALQRLFSSIPAKELKRLAQRGDKLAATLHRPVAYGESLRLLLWVVATISLSAAMLLLVPNLPGIVAFILLSAVLALALVWTPSLRLTVHTAHFAAFLAPGLAWILVHTEPVLGRAAATINRYRHLAPHSLLYEKEDLQQLLTLQKEQADNRILHHELETAERALVFHDRQAADIVQSYGKLHLVDADETVGPILLDQLHQSGQNSFLVYKDAKDNIIGSLSLRDAVNAKHDGRVFDLIRSDLTYVHEDFSLKQVLTAFQKTGHHLAVVINSFEEFVGIITFEALLAELLGDTSDADTESYDNRSYIAAYKPKKAPEQPPETQATDTSDADVPSPDATEVIE